MEKFKFLPIGAIFNFVSKADLPHDRLLLGPWRKVSPKCIQSIDYPCSAWTIKKSNTYVMPVRFRWKGS